MQLYNDIHDLRAQIGGAINTSINLEEMQPAIDRVIDITLTELVGADFVENYIDTDPDIPNLLKDSLKRAVAYLATYEYSKYVSAQMGGMGMVQYIGQDAKPVYRYQEAAYQNHMEQTGWEYLELMLKKAAANKTMLATKNMWNAVLEDSTMGHTINFAAQMRVLYNTQVSRALFQMMRPVIAEVEEVIMARILTPAVWQATRTYLMAGQLPADAVRNDLIRLMQRAVVHITIYECSLRNWVQVTPQGLMATQIDNDQGRYTRSPATPVQLNVIAKLHEDWARRLIDPIYRYLELYHTELGYEIPDDQVPDDPEHCCERYCDWNDWYRGRGNVVVGL